MALSGHVKIYKVEKEKNWLLLICGQRWTISHQRKVESLPRKVNYWFESSMRNCNMFGVTSEELIENIVHIEYIYIIYYIGNI